MQLPLNENESDVPNLTPLIDVVFLLLIFFLVATRFDQQEREINVNLPEVAAAQPLSMPPKEIIVNVTKDGGYKVSGRDYNEQNLAALLRESKRTNPHQSVQLRVDERAAFRYPAIVLGYCEREALKHRVTVLEEGTN